MRPRRPKQYCLQLDIALWCKNQIEHSIWDESLLFCNCACSLEYSSLSTLAGLSYHICGKLEVAFKASPSSQHQHCTDEAQKAETVSALVTFLLVICRFARMPSFQYPCSLVAQFSEEVYKNAGASDVLLLVMGSLDAAMQFLRAGKVRVTFQDSQTCSQILEDGIDLGDMSVQLFPADERLRIVYFRDLLVEIDDDVVSSFLADFGEVLSVDYCFFDHYPTVRNGHCVAKVLLDRDIPQYVEVEGCSCRVWYQRQPAQVFCLQRVWSSCPSLPTLWSLPALSSAWSYWQRAYAGLGPIIFCSTFCPS